MSAITPEDLRRRVGDHGLWLRTNRSEGKRLDLSGAVLRGADGILPLPVAEPRRYRWAAVAHTDGWRIAAGCRWYTLAEARAHWLSPDYNGPREVRETVGAALDWLERQPLPEMEGK